MVIVAEDLLLMDIGSAAYTEYDENGDVIAYMVEKDLLDKQRGLIHSHNKMKAFFSGTDVNTLREEAEDYNHFVSLVVNNFRQYVGIITTVVETTTEVKESFKYKTFEEEEKSGEYSDIKETKEMVYSYLNIILGDVEIQQNELLNRIKEIVEAKEAKRLAQEEARKKCTVPYNGGKVKPMFGLAHIPTGKEVINFKDDWDKKIPTDKFGRPFDTGIVEVTQQKIDFKELEDESTFDIDYDTITLNKEYIDTLTKKILTGSVLVTDGNQINLQEFISRMPKLFGPIFKEEGTYKFFIGGFIEALFNAQILPELEVEYDFDSINSILAYKIMEHLEGKGSNEYIEVIINELSQLIM